MDLRISKLSAEKAEEYVNFFDTTEHDDNKDEHKCYCVCWSNDDCKGKDFSKVTNRREYAWQYVKNENIKGYLAYSEKKVVGWCNANTKADCLKCESWRRFMSFVPLDDINSGLRVKSIFCFVIKPEMRGKGIATQLLVLSSHWLCCNAALTNFLCKAYL